MYLVVIAWLYVTVMMAVAEATSSTGSVLGAIFTFLLYGALPLSIVVYILGTPGRKRALRARQIAEQQAEEAAASVGLATPDASGHTTTAAQGDSIAPVRKEP
jgi:membrane protein implicated in regulation of membrane protease activity